MLRPSAIVLSEDDIFFFFFSVAFRLFLYGCRCRYLLDVQKVLDPEGDGVTRQGAVVVERAVVRDVRPHRKRHRLRLKHAPPRHMTHDDTRVT